MSKFIVGAICGFLACVWAVQTTPLFAFTALMQRVEEVRAQSAAASQAYDTLHIGQRRGPEAHMERTDYP